jgi:hypothetical protein
VGHKKQGKKNADDCPVNRIASMKAGGGGRGRGEGGEGNGRKWLRYGSDFCGSKFIAADSRRDFSAISAEKVECCNNTNCTVVD